MQVRCNALIKRGSLIMQNGKETEALSDFAAAVREDQDNSDIYHHRGQVSESLQGDLLATIRPCLLWLYT